MQEKQSTNQPNTHIFIHNKIVCFQNDAVEIGMNAVLYTMMVSMCSLFVCVFFSSSSFSLFLVFGCVFRRAFVTVFVADNTSYDDDDDCGNVPY